MTFPVVFHLFGLALPAHAVFEALAYFIGVRLYLWLRRRSPDPVSDPNRWTVLIGAIAGAGLGSKLLGFAEHPELWPLVTVNPASLLAAKTILGGLLGGIIGVEIAKKATGITRSTGDLYVFPLLAGIIIGRLGCALTGVSDGTWGDATHLPWGFDAGDGIIRHPTPLYEILFLTALAATLWLARSRLRPRLRLKNGDLFKLFILAYCAWRFLIEFLKPVTTYALTNNLNIVQNIATPQSLIAQPGLSMLQLAALTGFAVYLVWILRPNRGDAHGVA